MAHHDKAPARAFERFAAAATRFSGSVPAFGLALGTILVRHELKARQSKGRKG